MTLITLTNLSSEDGPDDGGSKYLWNICKLIPDYTVLQTRRQPSSYLPLWEPQIFPNSIFWKMFDLSQFHCHQCLEIRRTRRCLSTALHNTVIMYLTSNTHILSFTLVRSNSVALTSFDITILEFWSSLSYIFPMCKSESYTQPLAKLSLLFSFFTSRVCFCVPLPTAVQILFILTNSLWNSYFIQNNRLYTWKVKTCMYNCRLTDEVAVLVYEQWSLFSGYKRRNTDIDWTRTASFSWIHLFMMIHVYNKVHILVYIYLWLSIMFKTQNITRIKMNLVLPFTWTQDYFKWASCNNTEIHTKTWRLSRNRNSNTQICTYSAHTGAEYNHNSLLVRITYCWTINNQAFPLLVHWQLHPHRQTPTV
jgi:hypothetical protein